MAMAELTKYEGPDGDYLTHGTMYYRCSEADTELTRLREELRRTQDEGRAKDATIARLEADARRLEWLADPANAVRVMGNDERGWSVCDMSDGLVFLSRGCKSMREAIDVAIALSAPTGKGAP
jgi:hypothetical protein